MAGDGHHHRPTLKQSNKAFKSKHASKGSLKAAAKGKIASSPAQGNGKSQKNIQAGSKKARLHKQAQLRDAKRKAVGDDQKFFSTSSGGGNVPRIVSVVPLTSSLSSKRFLLNLLPSLGLPESEVESIASTLAEVGNYLIRAPRFKTSLQINLLPPLRVYQTLDAALVSDYVVLLLSSTDEVQLEGEAVLRCLQGQAGGVEIVPCVQAPESQPIIPSTKQLIHKSLLSFTRYFYPEAAKIYSSDTPNESALLARALCEAAPGGTRRNEGRAYLVAEGPQGVRFEASGSFVDGQEVKGRLLVTGTVRGGCFSANRLVHVPGLGDFQVESILAAPPSSLTLAQRPHQAAATMTVDNSLAPLSVPTEDADDLTATNVPDLLLNEQTWPTEEELAQGAAATEIEGAEEKRRVKKVPKGTSAYQAAWIIDDEDEDDEDDDDDDDDEDRDMDMDGEGSNDKEDEEDEEGEEMEEIELDERREDHRDLDVDQEEEQYAEYLRERERAAEQDMIFPDEIDTPRHISARIRFQRYRGLKSFRTSPWDPYENLPLEYGEIFQFENFSATKKRVEREGREEGVKPGTRIVVILKEVSNEAISKIDPAAPFILHGLLQHEHKQSVLHFVVQRNTEFTEPIRSKEPLVLCVGPRRYIIRPLYSQHVRGGGKGVNNVHKSEKFLRPGTATVATTFGPVCFGKAPCLLLRSEPSGPPSLVAMGSFLSADPTRIIAKRIILTGHPYKIHKKTATIRYMFFNREDVEYFRSVELHTKYGKIGHISEALGTHGYFKAHFDSPIQQMDTICMNLYKRQFPKWSEEFTAPRAEITAIEKGDDMEVE